MAVAEQRRRDAEARGDADAEAQWKQHKTKVAEWKEESVASPTASAGSAAEVPPQPVRVFVADLRASLGWLVSVSARKLLRRCFLFAAAVASPETIAEIAEDVAARYEKRAAKVAAQAFAAADAKLAKAEQGRLDAEAKGDAQSAAQWQRLVAEATAEKEQAEIFAACAPAIWKHFAILFFDSDPLVIAVLDPWLQINSLYRKGSSSREAVAQALDQVLARLTDLALWMPITREARLEWLSNPASRPFTPSAATEETDRSRLQSAVERLHSVDSSLCHPPAVALLRCMERVRDVLLHLQDSAPHSDLPLVVIESTGMAVLDLALSLHVKRDVRWIAPAAHAPSIKRKQSKD